MKNLVNIPLVVKVGCYLRDQMNLFISEERICDDEMVRPIGEKEICFDRNTDYLFAYKKEVLEKEVCFKKHFWSKSETRVIRFVKLSPVCTFNVYKQEVSIHFSGMEKCEMVNELANELEEKLQINISVEMESEVYKPFNREDKIKEDEMNSTASVGF